MANFLDVSEPQAAYLDQQTAAGADNQRMKDMASAALVSQYGNAAADPTMWNGDVKANTNQQIAPLTVQDAQDATQQNQLAIRQAAELRAAQALKVATSQGQDMGAAYDSVVGPNASVLGLSPTDSATLRDHLVKNPTSLDAMITGLAGVAKPMGQPVMYRNPDGTLGYAMMNDRGGTTPVQLPQGATAVAPMTGSPTLTKLSDGSYGMIMRDKAGGVHEMHVDGTPVAAITANASQQKADAYTSQAGTAAYNAGVRANNSTYGAPGGTAPGGAAAGPVTLAQAVISQESGNNPNAPTSVNGAVGPGQVTPAFFKTFAKPGENINNPADNAAVSARGLAYYRAKYGDDGRAAVAYFSGPGNVAPAGSKTPWIHNAADGNGTLTSTYVGQVLGRMGGGAQSGAPAAPQPLFNTLPPKGHQLAVSAAQGIVNGSQQLASVDQQLGNIDKIIGPFSVGLGALSADIPGTPAANLKAALVTLRSQGLTSWLQSLKNAGGSTGIGRVLQSEATAAMNSFGALEQNQSEGQFRYHLGIFQTRIHQLQNNAESAFKSQYGTDAFSAIGVAQPGAPNAAHGGAGLSDAQLLAKYGVH